MDYNAQYQAYLNTAETALAQQADRCFNERSRGIAQELTDGACGVLRAAFGGRAQFLETLAASLLERNQ